MKTSILCYQIALGEINSCYFKLQVPSIERVIDLGHSLILIIGSGYQSFYKNEFYPTPWNIEWRLTVNYLDIDIAQLKTPANKDNSTNLLDIKPVVA